ncbi:MAG: DUF3301 domain-containing protein [Thioalkalivibrio sp.]
MTPILLILLAGLILWYINDSLRCRETVLRAARRACEQMQVQLLDQSVARTRMRFSRTGSGSLALRREYRFDFSLDGGDRYAGHVVCLGQRVIGLNLEHPSGRVLE